MQDKLNHPKEKLHLPAALSVVGQMGSHPRNVLLRRHVLAPSQFEFFLQNQCKS